MGRSNPGNRVGFAAMTYPVRAPSSNEPAPVSGYNSNDGPVTLNDLTDTDLTTITLTPNTTGTFLMIANTNCQNAPMAPGSFSFFLSLLDGDGNVLRTHPAVSVGPGESHAGIIQAKATGYPLGVPVTFRFTGRASGGAGSNLSAIAIDFSVVEQDA